MATFTGHSITMQAGAAQNILLEYRRADAQQAGGPVSPAQPSVSLEWSSSRLASASGAEPGEGGVMGRVSVPAARLFTGSAAVHGSPVPVEVLPSFCGSNYNDAA